MPWSIYDPSNKCQHRCGGYFGDLEDSSFQTDDHRRAKGITVGFRYCTDHVAMVNPKWSQNGDRGLHEAGVM